MTILTGCEDGTARLWKTATEQPFGTPLQHHSIVGAVSFSPDGQDYPDRESRLDRPALGHRHSKTSW